MTKPGRGYLQKDIRRDKAIPQQSQNNDCKIALTGAINPISSSLYLPHPHRLTGFIFQAGSV
jgi:hypothetical protein